MPHSFVCRMPMRYSSKPFSRYARALEFAVLLTNLRAQDKNLEYIFDRVTTNPAQWKDGGLLEVRRRIDPHGPQHSCQVGCSPNMCKGEELSAFLKEHGDYDKVIYIGDGSNDFCPILRLRECVTLILYHLLDSAYFLGKIWH